MLKRPAPMRMCLHPCLGRHGAPAGMCARARLHESALSRRGLDCGLEGCCMRARSAREAREQSLDEGHATTLQRSGEPELGLPLP